jgi:chemotaxis protein methyltransferase CheR
MQKAGSDHFFTVQMRDRDFYRLSEYIESEYGIKMPYDKKSMLEARLRKRLRHLGIETFEEYIDFVFSAQGRTDEEIYMMDVVTTNKTDFFREPAHFDYLFQNLLPELITKRGAGIGRPLSVWSAGCSTGEEPYTLSIVLSEFARRYPGFQFDFMILATDLSTRVLAHARRAVYHEDRIAHVPMELKKKYFLRSREHDRKLVRIVPELRDKVRFRRLNLMDEDFGFRETMDIIFCRNVIIYFDRSTQERLVNRFYRNLTPGGFVFMGHSETLSGLNVPLNQVAPTIYRKTGESV